MDDGKVFYFYKIEEFGNTEITFNHVKCLFQIYTEKCFSVSILYILISNVEILFLISLNFNKHTSFFMS